MMARRSTFALALASTALFGWGAQADTRVGVTSAVNPAAAGTPPGATAARQLTVGSDIVFRERVITTTDGQAQILFLDQSSLLIGPNSTVVIDEFVYDPATSKGNIAATLTQGSFRYIGGKLSKQGNATLKTPVATIGIRGSDVTARYEAARNLMNVIATHGIANVQTLGGALVGLRSGFGATIDGARPPAAPTALSAQQIADANKQFEGQPGKNAGAGKPPTDGDVAKSGLSASVEAQGVAAIEPAAGNALRQAVQMNVPFRVRPNDTVGTQDPSTISSDAPVNPGTGIRSEQTLNGYVAGFAFPHDETSVYSDILTNDSPDDVVVQTRPDANGQGRVFAVFNFRGTDSESLASAKVEFGDRLDGTPAVQSIFLDNAAFIAWQNAASGKAHVNGEDSTVDAIMVSARGLDLGEITGTPQAGICTCEFVNWGFWLADLSSESKNLYVPMALWVAGKLPQVTDPSPQGSATFSGTALGMVQDGGAQRFATGAFTNNYNFTQRTGQVNISNFDGRSFGGTVNAGADWRNYSGALSGSGLTGSINGSFYGNRGPTNALQVPKETAGNFNVGNSGYAASGIFIGRR
jgi:hypothetical protein